MPTPPIITKRHPTWQYNGWPGTECVVECTLTNGQQLVGRRSWEHRDRRGVGFGEAGVCAVGNLCAFRALVVHSCVRKRRIKVPSGVAPNLSIAGLQEYAPE
jgi:hypothetical protein